MPKASEEEQRRARFWLSPLLGLSAPPLFCGAHTVGFQGKAGPGGFGRRSAGNQGQCPGSKREWDRGRGSSLWLSNSPLEGGREGPRGRGGQPGERKGVGKPQVGVFQHRGEAGGPEKGGHLPTHTQPAGGRKGGPGGRPHYLPPARWTPHSLSLVSSRAVRVG